MPRFALILVMAMVAICAQGFPYRENDLPSAAARGDWDEVHRILSERLRSRYGLTPLSSIAQVNNVEVKDLKPIDGGHVYGESSFEFHKSSNVNGKTDEHSGGHRVINNDGKVTEYDYNPQQLAKN